MKNISKELAVFDEYETARLSDVVRSARLSAGLTLRQLAEQSGVPKTTIVRTETASRFQPKPQTLLNLARTLELPSAQLFELAGIPASLDRPSLPAMLRTELDLPPEAIAEVQQSIEEIARKYRNKKSQE